MKSLDSFFFFFEIPDFWQSDKRSCFIGCWVTALHKDLAQQYRKSRGIINNRHHKSVLFFFFEINILWKSHALHDISRKTHDFNLLACHWLPWKACGCRVDLFTVAFGLAKLRCWAMAWMCGKHCSAYKIPTARQQCPNVSCISEVACWLSRRTHTSHTAVGLGLGLSGGISAVLCFCWLFFKKSFSKPPRLRWPPPRPQTERGI